MKKRILILDDKETIAKILHIYLMGDYDCIWLSDGLQGMKWLQDGNTPEHIPVIMLSSEDSTSERIRLLEIGAADYIVKPFNPLELKVRVKKII